MTAAPGESPPPAPANRQDGDGKGPFTVFDPDGPFRAFTGAAWAAAGRAVVDGTVRNGRH